MGIVRRLAIVAALGLVAVPAVAQFSASFNFLQAVKDRNGEKANDAINSDKSVVATRDPKNGDTVTHIVVRRHDFQWLQFVLGNGAPIDSKNNDGLTPLMVAAQTGDMEAAHLLISIGANLNAVNNSGETPIIMAVHARDRAMAETLIANGADPKLKDNIAGKSAIDYASEDPRGTAIARILAAAKPKKAASCPIAGPMIH